MRNTVKGWDREQNFIPTGRAKLGLGTICSDVASSCFLSPILLGIKETGAEKINNGIDLVGESQSGYRN